MAGTRSVDLMIMSVLSGESMETLANSHTAQALGALLIRDGLTGLYNQKYFERRLSMTLESAGETDTPVSVLVVGLDGLEQVNAALGNAVGDQLTIVAARELAAQVHVSGYVARCTGDRLFVALPGKCEADAQQFALWLRDHLARTEVSLVDGTVLQTIAASFGIAQASSSFRDVAALLAAADQAMRYARAAKAGAWRHSGLRASMQQIADRLGAAAGGGEVPGLITLLACQFPKHPGESQLLDDPHYRLQRENQTVIATKLERTGGLVFRYQHRDNRIYAAFARASDAVTAVIALAHFPGGLCVALDTTKPASAPRADLRLGDDHCGRLVELGNRDQVLMSAAAAGLLQPWLPPEAKLIDLGEHRLRDLTSVAHVFQLRHPAFAGGRAPLRSLGSLPHNLPSQSTSFVGREKEMADVRRGLSTSRLVTLTGPGGSGKTRLALQAAAELLDCFVDGVWLVELVALRDGAQVADAVAAALDVKGVSDESLLETLNEHLRHKHLLLVLDNCEHLAPACRRVVGSLLPGCPRLKVLATSREPIGVTGEAVLRIPGLAAPDPLKPSSLESLLRYDAVRLFLERARLQKPDFTLSRENASAVLRICHQLDGLALALELAAAQMRTLTPKELLPRLDSGLQVLATQEQAVPTRHRTLQALVDWSHDLLLEAERKLWYRLSVFAGTFTLDAALGICANDGIGPGDVPALLSTLVGKSLVAVENRSGVRYRLLQSTKAYAAEKLWQSGEDEIIHRRHRDWYLSLVEETNLSALDRGEAALVDRLDSERDNLWSALQWSRRQGDVPVELRFVQGLTPVWAYRQSEAGQEWLSGLLETANKNPHLRAKVLFLAGNVSYLRGQYEATSTYWRGALALYREQGELVGGAKVLSNLAVLTEMRNGPEAAIDAWSEAARAGRDAQWIYPEVRIAIHEMSTVSTDSERLLAQLSEAVETIHEPSGHAGMLWYAADAAAVRGEIDWAEARLKEAEGIYRSLHLASRVALVLAERGHLARQQGNQEQAQELFGESLALFNQFGGGLKEGEADALEGVAALLIDHGDAEGAAHLLGAVERLRAKAGLPLRPAARNRYEASVALVRSRLSAAELAAAWSGGIGMRLNQAVRYAIGRTSPGVAPK